MSNGQPRGLVVSVVSFYLVDLPSNPAKVYSFYSVNLFEKRVKINKKDVWWVVDIVKNQNTLSILDSISYLFDAQRISNREPSIKGTC